MAKKIQSLMQLERSHPEWQFRCHTRLVIAPQCSSIANRAERFLEHHYHVARPVLRSSLPPLNHSIAPRLPTCSRIVTCAYGIATAATNAVDAAICAMDKTFFIVLLPSAGFSGTTIVSPGPVAAESTPPDQ